MLYLKILIGIPEHVKWRLLIQFFWKRMNGFSSTLNYLNCTCCFWEKSHMSIRRPIWRIHVIICDHMYAWSTRNDLAWYIRHYRSFTDVQWKRQACCWRIHKLQEFHSTSILLNTISSYLIPSVFVWWLTHRHHLRILFLRLMCTN